MSEHTATFVDLCMAGTVLMDEIDDFIEAWHDSESDVELHDYLGMTLGEYTAWVDESWLLPYIVTAHREGTSLKAVLDSLDEMKLAARSADAERAHRLVDWLQEQGKLG